MVVVLLLEVSAPGQNVPADKGPKLKVGSTSGKTLTLAPPISGDWTFEVQGCRVTLSPDGIAKIVRRGAALRIELVNGQTLDASDKASGAVSGMGEWGTTRIDWAKINSVEVVPDKQASGEPASDATTPPKAPPVWRLTVGETVLDLTGISQTNPVIECGEFQVAVAFTSLKSAESAGKGIRLTARDGTALSGAATANSTIYGQADWGHLIVPLAKVGKLERLREPDDQPSQDRSGQSSSSVPCRITSVSGASMDVFLEVSFGDFDFSVDGFDISVDVSHLVSLEPAKDGTIRVSLDTGKSFAGRSKRDAASVSGRNSWGVVSIPYEKVTRLERVAPTSRPATAPVTADSVLILQTNSGLALVAWDVKPQDLKCAFGVVSRINWSAVDKITIQDGTLALTDSDGLSLTLNGGKIAGQSDLGTFSLALSSIQSAGMQPSRQVTKATAQPKGTVLLGTGQRLPVTKLVCEGSICSHTRWLDDHIEFQRDGLLYWVPKQMIENGFVTRDGRLAARLCGVDGPFEAAEAEVTLETTVAQLKCKLSQIAEYKPAIANETVTTPRDRVIGVDVTLRDGTVMTFQPTSAGFVTYPDKGWTGMYAVSAWPFQWWRSDEMDVKRKDDDTRLQVHIGKLASLTVPGSTYDHNLEFESLNGTTLPVVRIWDDLNADSKHGPSTWCTAKEGVLLSFGGEGYVFVPFVTIQKIALARSQEQPRY